MHAGVGSLLDLPLFRMMLAGHNVSDTSLCGACITARLRHAQNKPVFTPASPAWPCAAFRACANVESGREAAVWCIIMQRCHESDLALSRRRHDGPMSQLRTVIRALLLSVSMHPRRFRMQLSLDCLSHEHIRTSPALASLHCLGRLMVTASSYVRSMRRQLPPPMVRWRPHVSFAELAPPSSMVEASLHVAHFCSLACIRPAFLLLALPSPFLHTPSNDSPAPTTSLPRCLKPRSSPTSRLSSSSALTSAIASFSSPGLSAAHVLCRSGRPIRVITNSLFVNAFPLQEVRSPPLLVVSSH